MSAPDLNILKNHMILAAKASGKVLMKYFAKTLNVREKDNAGLVTQADTEAEAAALKILKKHYPHFGVLAEESGALSGQKNQHQVDRGRFIIDPLDGTTNYVHGFPMFCVSIGAEYDGKIVAGVIYHPVFKDLYVAVRRKGATLNSKRIRVSQTQSLRDSLLTTGFTYRKNELLHTEMEAFERLSGIVRAIRRPGSAALDLAYTARGVFDGFWERRLSPWDVAAGALLVQEAGGTVTDFQGNAFEVESSQIMASNGKLHQDLMNQIKQC